MFFVNVAAAASAFGGVTGGLKPTRLAHGGLPGARAE
jgi:hypothetical protein